MLMNGAIYFVRLDRQVNKHKTVVLLLLLPLTKLT